MITRKRTNDRITVEALRYYVPLFQLGEAAELELLESFDTLDSREVHRLQSIMRLKELSTQKIAALAGPLITREINKIIVGSHLKGKEDLFDLLYLAGLDGMRRGLRKFEVDKLTSSSTNYLFQWIVTYAKKELVMLEAPYGIPPSRFQRYKKISAVRKRLNEQQNRYVSNEEIFEYFNSGKADIKTMNGRLADRGKPSQANKSITLDLIVEQEKFEKDMLTVDLLDPLEDYSADAQMSEETDVVFSETVFGVFIDTHPVTNAAKVVMKSELSARYLTESEHQVLAKMENKEYKSIATQWKNLIKDVNGPFYKFLIENKDVEFVQFNIQTAIDSIKAESKPINSNLYSILFLKEAEGVEQPLV